jgi:hypothetical protein
MAKKLIEEEEAVAISEIMLEVRRIFIEAKVKAKKEREGGRKRRAHH